MLWDWIPLAALVASLCTRVVLNLDDQPERVPRTMETIREAGFKVDDELWPMDNAKCGNCQENGNCTASGPDGNDPGAR